jgi:hypothetical protein
MGSVKPVYKLSEIARAFQMPRWAARRWLDANRVPYYQARTGHGGRGTGIRILLSDLRTYAPKLYASIEESVRMSAK